MNPPAHPGFLFVSAAPGSPLPALPPAAGAHTDAGPGWAGATWGGAVLATDAPLLLSRQARRRDTTLDAAAVRRMLLDADREALAQMLPPFAAAVRTGDGGLVATTDAMGMRQLYLRTGPGWTAVSTSARLLGRIEPVAAPDPEGVAVQSLLGWQLGRRTLLTGIAQLEAAHLLTVYAGRPATTSFAAPGPGPLGMGTAVTLAAALLRGHLAAWLEDHPDPVLQLTGGQDSRLLLSAIEPGRRVGLRATTLRVPGSLDVEVAARLAARCGLSHEVLELPDLARLEPPAAYRWCVEAAERLGLTADPIARAALDLAEAHASPGARISGLGGEIARGFYYLGRRAGAPVTSERSARLAGWRLFANEAASTEALDPGFAAWARGFATEQVHRALARSGDRWFDATDRLYLEERMQRWAGATETATCLEREIANPMLDDRFLAIAHGLSPADKRRARFLARLQVALDPELAQVPLEGRPAPVRYAAPGVRGSLAQTSATLSRAGRKAAQRWGGRRRPPAGGPVLAARVVDHWRAHPDLLEPVEGTGIVRGAWLDQLVRGVVEPDAATVALLLNLSLAAAPVEAVAHS